MSGDKPVPSATTQWGPAGVLHEALALVIARRDRLEDEAEQVGAAADLIRKIIAELESPR